MASKTWEPLTWTSIVIAYPQPWLSFDGRKIYGIHKMSSRTKANSFHPCLYPIATRCRQWTTTIAFSALVENVVEGILQRESLKHHELCVEEYRDGALVEASGESTSSRESGAIEGQTVEFFFYRVDCPSLASEGTKCPHLGYIAWRPREDAPDYGDVELYNVGEITGDAVWNMGFTTKSRDTDLAGQYGEGAKLGKHLCFANLHIYICSSD